MRKIYVEVMPQTIFSTLTGALDSQGVSSIASTLGEPQGAVARGMKTAAAAILGQLAGKSTDIGMLRQVIELAANTPEDALHVRALSSALSDSGSTLISRGRQLTSKLFETGEASAIDKIIRTSGLNFNSASTLMSLVAPMILAALGKRIRAEGVTAGGLGHLLQHESSSTVTKTATPAPVSAAQVPSPLRWVIPVAVVAVLLGMFLFAGRPASEKGAADRMMNAADLSSLIGRKLPNGIDLRIPGHGAEMKLLDFVVDANRTLDKEPWISFDRLLFDTNSDVLRPESEEQLRNIASVLQAYPNVRMRVGGYTDNTGSAEQNLKLSADRAHTVVAELVRLGVDSGRLEAEGYGENYPVADNSSPEGRASNRRISMRVIQK